MRPQVTWAKPRWRKVACYGIHMKYNKISEENKENVCINVNWNNPQLGIHNDPELEVQYVQLSLDAVMKRRTLNETTTFNVGVG